MQSSSVTTANRQIARAAGIVMITFVVGKVVGLVAYQLMGYRFGTGPEMEAYQVANRFSEILFNLIAGGALGSAFIPTFTTMLTNEDRHGAWRLASAIANLVLMVTVVVGLLGAIFAPWVVTRLLAPGFKDPAQQALTVDLLRIQLPSVAIFGMSGLVMGILNAHKNFLFPALAPSMYPLGIIFGALVLAPSMGVFGAAWGVVIGSALHLLVQVPQLFKLPERTYMPTLGLNFPAVREVLLLMGPRFAGVAVVQLNFWVNTLIASNDPGSIPFISYAFVIMIMPQAAIAQSIAIASLPTFSAQVALGKREEMRASLAATLRAILLLAIPAMVGLIMLRTPIVAAMFQFGKFDEQSTMMTAWALLWYSAGLVGHCLVEIISRAFYALHDTRTPVLVGIVAMSLNVVLSLLLWSGFNQVGLPPHGGLALANSLATGLESLVLLVLMRRRLNGLEAVSIFRASGASLIAVGGMGAVLWGLIIAFPSLPNILLVVISMAAGGLVYALLLLALRVPEVQQAAGFILKRLQRTSANV